MNDAWADAIEEKAKVFQDTSRALNAIADEVVLGPVGAIARNYSSSGLKQRTGTALRAMATRNPISYVNVFGPVLTVGVSIEAYQYKEGHYGQGGGRISTPMLIGILLYGHRAIYPRMRKALRWVDDSGTVHFAKRVKAAPGHDIYYLTAEDVAKSQMVAAREFGYALEG